MCACKCMARVFCSIVTPRWSSYHTAVTSLHCDGKNVQISQALRFQFFLRCCCHRCCWCCQRKSLLNIRNWEIKREFSLSLSLFSVVPCRTTSKSERHMQWLADCVFFSWRNEITLRRELESEKKIERKLMWMVEAKRMLFGTFICSTSQIHAKCQ